MTTAPEPRTQPPDDRYAHIDVVPDRDEAQLPNDLPEPPPDLFDIAVDAAIAAAAWLASMRDLLAQVVFAGAFVSTGAPVWAAAAWLTLFTAAWLAPKWLLSDATDESDLREDLAGIVGFGLSSAMVADRSTLGTLGALIWAAAALACLVSAVLVVRRARRAK